MTTIPIIDVSSFASVYTTPPTNYSDDILQKQAHTAEEMYKACIDTGFFLIRGYDDVLPQQKVDKLFVLMEEFFKLPSEEKKKYPPLHNRGAYI